MEEYPILSYLSYAVNSLILCDLVSSEHSRSCALALRRQRAIKISPYKASCVFVFRTCYHTTAELWRENIFGGYMSGFVWSPVNTNQLNLYNGCTDIIEAIALYTRGWGFGFIIHIEITEVVILRSVKPCPHRLPQKDLSPSSPRQYAITCQWQRRDLHTRFTVTLMEFTWSLKSCLYNNISFYRLLNKTLSSWNPQVCEVGSTKGTWDKRGWVAQLRGIASSRLRGFTMEIS